MVLRDTYERWGLQDLDVVVSVNGMFCLGDAELTEKIMGQSNVAKKVTVARAEQFGFELKECVIPIDDDGVPVRLEANNVPLSMFVEIRKVACPEQQKTNAALALLCSHE